MPIFAINFILVAFHITGAFYSPILALHSWFLPITALSHAYVLLAFSVLSPRYPSSIWSCYPHRLYIVTVFNITCIRVSCAFWTDFPCISSHFTHLFATSRHCGFAAQQRDRLTGAYNGKRTSKCTLLDARSVFFDVSFCLFAFPNLPIWAPRAAGR